MIFSLFTIFHFFIFLIFLNFQIFQRFFHNNLTCWRSEPVITKSNTLQNITMALPLHKTFEIHYISLQFCTSRPRNLIIHKSQDYGQTWTPYQFYSDSCRARFGIQAKDSASRSNEQEALCSEDHSALYPVKGTRIAFSTTEGRPSAHNIDASPVLQDWISATNIKVEFLEPNVHPDDRPIFDSMVAQRNYNHFSSQNKVNSRSITSSDQVSNALQRPREINQFKDSLDYSKWLVRDTYYYGVSDLSVGGRCKCNGHASKCVIDPETKQSQCYIKLKSRNRKITS